MLEDVVADDVEIVSEGGGDDLGAIEVVTLALLELFDVLNEGVEDNQEDGSRIGVTLKDALHELKGISFPVLRDYSSPQFRVNVLYVRNYLRWEVVVGKHIRDECMRDRPKGVCKVKPGHVCSVVSGPGMSYHFLNYLCMCSTHPLIPSM